MSTRALIVFEHASRLGEAPAHSLFARVTVDARRRPARSFGDYEVQLDGQEIKALRHTVKVVSPVA
jgi:CRISPR-associated protein Csd2